MRRLDPRPWDLLPSALLLTAACGPPGIPYEDGADDIADDIADAPEDGGECTYSSDCPPNYYCAGEVCLPEVYSDEEYTDWSDYSDDYTTDDYTSYTDYSDYTDNYEGPWYECYSDYDCPQDYECVYNYCQPKPPGSEPIECDGPAITEIPLPDLGVVLDIQFADVDGDDDDELVVLRADDVVVVEGDDSMVSSVWSMPPPVPLRQIALLQLDDDGVLDLVAFPDVQGPAIVSLGVGSSAFASIGEMANSPIVDRPFGFDGDLDGIDRLLAHRPDIDRITQFSDPVALSGNNILVGPSGASDLDLMRLDSMLAPDVLIGIGCSASIRTGVGLNALDFIPDPMLGVGVCEWQAVAFADGDPDQPLLVLSQGDHGILQRWDLANDLSWQVNIPIGPTSSTVANLDGTGDYLLLTDPGLGRAIWGWVGDEPACIASLPFLGTLDFAVGDRNGDGTEDVATLDNMGVVKLWSVP